MQVVLVGLVGEIYWRVPPDGTMSPPLAALGQWSIVSPLSMTEEPNLSVRNFGLLPDNKYLMVTNHLELVTGVQNPAVVDDWDNLYPKILTFLQRLRVYTGQCTLPRLVPYLKSASSVSQLPAPRTFRRDNSECITREYIVESSLNWDDLKEIDELITNQQVPIHRELINDAAEALSTANFRSAIIFAAMAVETCAGSILDAEYARLQATATSSPHHRFILITVNESQSVKKDPVFIALRSSASEGGSRFLPLLHEVPLYLLGKSLQQERPELYQTAHALYRTRNSLAHTGVVSPDASGLLSVDHDGAVAALEAANSILDWFGQEGTVLPIGGMVPLVGVNGLQPVS